uniref:tRNA (Guanine(9)-/adenine(9)-N1)-methyltransferase n=1 Tax=Lygus hesperus TaxID=30085 RepID=A0A0A9X696_LYGHE
MIFSTTSYFFSREVMNVGHFGLRGWFVAKHQLPFPTRRFHDNLAMRGVAQGQAPTFTKPHRSFVQTSSSNNLVDSGFLDWFPSCGDERFAFVLYPPLPWLALQERIS